MPGRYTAASDEPVVVFLIGMRVNKLLAIRKWWSVAKAMPPMMKTLYEHPEKGFLGGRSCLNWRGVTMIQYWRSFEDLENFAKNTDDPHLEAWKKFNKAVGSDGTVGVWHETYQVLAGQYESVYANMPVFGLATATGHLPIGKQSQTARRRMGREEQEAVEKVEKSPEAAKA